MYLVHTCFNKHTCCKIFAVTWFFSLASDCGTVLPDDEGTCSHPEYPEDYGSNADCEWTTTAKEKDKVFFTFELLDIEQANNGGCEYDYVR